MATYAELLQAEQDPTLHNKIRVAVVIAAEMVRTEDVAVTDHTKRLAWAKNVYANPDSEVGRMKRAVLAQNQAATLAAIVGASDATVQAAVNNAINVFAS